MANRKKTYFLVPGWDIPPAAIQLGNIIADPTAPHMPLNGSFTKTKAPDIDTPIYPTSTKNFKTSSFSSRSNRFGIWAEFLQMFGLGGEASVSFSHGDEDTYSFGEMQTEWFSPSADFVERSVRADNVQDFLKMAGRKTPLYIITGVKTVRGATVSTSQFKTHGHAGHFGVDGTSIGAPITVGLKVGHERQKGQKVSWRCEGPIVFAYQLAQVRFKKDSWVIGSYEKGALFERTDEKSDLGPTVGVTVPILLDEGKALARDGALDDSQSVDSDALLEGMQLKSGFDEEMGEECTLVVPNMIEL
jgi:hypothetical protein